MTSGEASGGETRERTEVPGRSAEGPAEPRGPSAPRGGAEGPQRSYNGKASAVGIRWSGAKDSPSGTTARRSKGQVSRWRSPDLCLPTRQWLTLHSRHWKKKKTVFKTGRGPKAEYLFRFRWKRVLFESAGISRGLAVPLWELDSVGAAPDTLGKLCHVAAALLETVAMDSLHWKPAL
ncbi:unnamed protein product [Boreogadus saida]